MQGDPGDDSPVSPVLPETISDPAVTHANAALLPAPHSPIPLEDDEDHAFASARPVLKRSGASSPSLASSKRLKAEGSDVSGERAANPVRLRRWLHSAVVVTGWLACHCCAQSKECPICFEQWTNKGKHRICCLACGHMFGELCIVKWVQVRRCGDRRAAETALMRVYRQCDAFNAVCVGGHW